MENILFQKALGLVTIYGPKATEKTDNKQLLIIIQNLLTQRQKIKAKNISIPKSPTNLW